MRYSEVQAFLAVLIRSLVDPGYRNNPSTPPLTKERLCAGLAGLPDLADVVLFHSWRRLEQPPPDLCIWSGELLLDALLELHRLHEALAGPPAVASEPELFQMLTRLDRAFGVWETSIGSEQCSGENQELLLHRLRYCRWILETTLVLARFLSPPDPGVLDGLGKIEAELARPDWHDAFEFDAPGTREQQLQPSQTGTPSGYAVPHQ